jgi:hypothetical protein
MIFQDPKTRQRIPYNKHTGDFIYQSDQASESVTHETIPVIGPWVDYTGSGGNESRSQQFFGACENTFQGEDASLSGERQWNLGNVGQRLGTTRRRVKLNYVDTTKLN